MKNETKVGVIIIFGTLAIAISIMILSGIRFFEKGYKVNILYNDIQGLLTQAKVQVAGVNVGYVKNIDLENEKAKVTVWINENVKVYKNTQAYIFSSGIIGVKFIQLTPGTAKTELLSDEDTIMGIDPVSIDMMFEKAQSAIGSILNSLKDITENTGIKSTISNLNTFSKDLTIISGELRKISSKGRLDIISQKLSNTLTSLENISKSIENREGLLGDIITNKKIQNDLKDTIWSLRVFSKVLEDAPSKWIVDDKKAKEIKSNLEKERKK